MGGEMRAGDGVHVTLLGVRVCRRRSRASLLLGSLTVVALVVSAHQLLLLAHDYSDYILALLPGPQLPLQTRPPREEPAATSIEGHKGRAPRVLCLILTSPQYHQTRAVHVAATWGPHCTRAVFLTSGQDPALPDTVLTPGAATYDRLWQKVVKGFEWAYERRSEFDFVVKADDDTFVLVENLQAAVLSLDPAKPMATGVHLRTWETSETYLNGGASYVLSRGAVERLVEEGLQGRRCRDDFPLHTGEDVNMARCLMLLGVQLLDSRDPRGRQRFHIYPPQILVDPRQEGALHHLWLKRISIFPYKFGYSELSEDVISFHYVDAQTMYLIYYLVYLVSPPTDPSLHPVAPPRPLPGATKP